MWLQHYASPARQAQYAVKTLVFDSQIAYFRYNADVIIPFEH